MTFNAILLIAATGLIFVYLTYEGRTRDLRPLLAFMSRCAASVRSVIPPTPTRSVHVGATEAYGAELHEMGALPVSDELVTPLEHMTIIHNEMDDIMRELRAGLDAVCDTICERLDRYYGRTMVDTGQLDMTALHEMLARDSVNA